MSSQQRPTAMDRRSVVKENVYRWIGELQNPETRENALMELSKRRKEVPDLAVLLWDSFGTITILLQEIMNIYQAIKPETLTADQSKRMSYTLLLLKRIAGHPETCMKFLNCEILQYILPFLTTKSKDLHFEKLKLHTLFIVTAILKTHLEEVVKRLLDTEIMSLCLQIMDSGPAIGLLEIKTSAALIVCQMLEDESGLAYITKTNDRISHVTTVLGKMVMRLQDEPSPALLRYIILCYLRLCDHPGGKEILRQCLPDVLRNNTPTSSFQIKKATRLGMLANLLIKLETDDVVPVEMPPLVPQ